MPSSSKIMKMAKALATALRWNPQDVHLPSVIEHLGEFSKLPKGVTEDLSRLVFKEPEGESGLVRFGLYDPSFKEMIINPQWSRKNWNAVHPKKIGSTVRHEAAHHLQFNRVDDVSVDMRYFQRRLNEPYATQPIEIHAAGVEKSKKPFYQSYVGIGDQISSWLDQGRDPMWIKANIDKMVKAGVLSAAAAVALSTKIDKAEASPAGVFEKAIVKSGESISSAARRLIGESIQGKKIVNVLKGKGSWRKILFEDETQMIVDKQYVNDLSRAAGTRQYIETFRDKTDDAKTVQALKSMQYHENRVDAHEAFTKQSFREMHKRHLKRLKQIGFEAPGTVFVKRADRYFQMPQNYAQHLEDLGILKIVRGKEELKMMERFGVNVERRKEVLNPGGENTSSIVEKGRRRIESQWPRTEGRRKTDRE